VPKFRDIQEDRECRGRTGQAGRDIWLRGKSISHVSINSAKRTTVGPRQRAAADGKLILDDCPAGLGHMAKASRT
jgi:hypothetical protein